MLSNGREAFNFYKENNSIDVILMDIRMNICNGVLGTRLIKEAFSKITFNDEKYILEALKYGASGYLLKDSSLKVLYEGIKSAFIGNIVVHPDVSNKIVYSNKNIDYDNTEDICKNFNLTSKIIFLLFYLNSNYVIQHK